MNKNILKGFTLLALTFGILSCEKEFDDNSLAPTEDRIANIPVTVTNAEFFELYPIKTTSVAAGGKFSINFQIPADKGKIKEISRVTTGTSIGLPNVQAGSISTAYNTTGSGTTLTVSPIAGNGTNEIVFSSDLATYTAYRNRIGTNAGPSGPATTTGGPVTAPVPSTTQSPTEITYYFLLTLEDNTTVIPMPVRVRVVQ
ncbi:hypothetical protein DNI29_05650 [Hymenobacter sediminis]|uniref:hypothetical protein n=1 Tax=Hymenobacter sediminis TaxID=2218621 RepID=UPI000F500A75|nr:hypothetical protein [Hymenobacter sediminis]RPD50280.1 hypothetical protein DNI29_05650 [Hymenobacter sediminis]